MIDFQARSSEVLDSEKDMRLSGYTVEESRRIREQENLASLLSYEAALWEVCKLAGYKPGPCIGPPPPGVDKLAVQLVKDLTAA